MIPEVDIWRVAYLMLTIPVQGSAIQMRTALPICVLLAVCIALPGSASAKQPRSASVKRGFSANPSLPGQWSHERSVPRLCEGPRSTACVRRP